MIIEDLLAKEEGSTPFPGHWRMSGYGGCQREQLAWAQSRPLTRGTNQGAAYEGSVHEVDLVVRLREAGYVVTDALHDQVELTLRWGGDDWPLIGHPDGKIEVAGAKMRLELKSKGLARFKKLQKDGVEKAYPVEFAQVMAYMAAEGLAQCLYICKNRDNGKLYEEIIPFDTGWFDTFLDEHFAPIVVGYERDDEPETLPCHTDASVRQWCAYRYMCEAEEVTPVVHESDLPEVEAVHADMQRWAEIVEAHREMGEEITLIKKRAKEFMIKNGTKKAVIAGVALSLSSFERSSLDRDALEELVPEEIITKATKSVPVEQLRLTK